MILQQSRPRPRINTNRPANLNAIRNALQHRFRRGRVLSFVEAAEVIANGGWIYLQGNYPYHPEFVLNLPLRTLKNACARGFVSEAVLNQVGWENYK